MENFVKASLGFDIAFEGVLGLESVVIRPLGCATPDQKVPRVIGMIKTL